MNSHTEKITDLSGQLNGFKLYKSVTELGLSSTSTFAEIANTMQNYSILITTECGDVKPTTYGSLTVKRTSNTNRVEFMWSVSKPGGEKTEMYIAHHHSTGGFSGWSKLATTDKIDILEIPYQGGFSDYDTSVKSRITRVNNLATVYICCKCSAQMEANRAKSILTLPNGFKPNVNEIYTAGMARNNGVAKPATFAIKGYGGIEVTPSEVCQAGQFIFGTFSYYV